MLVNGNEFGAVAEEKRAGVRGLLGNNAVAEEAQHRRARQVQVGDMAVVEPHKELHEPRAEDRPAVSSRLGGVRGSST